MTRWKTNTTVIFIMKASGVQLKNNYSYHVTHVLYFLTVIRFIQLVIVYFTPFQFDTSTSILIERYASTRNIVTYPTFVLRIFNKLMSWDSVYFLKLAMEGTTFEHEWVFGPLWWRLMYYPKKYFGFSLGLYDALALFITLNTILTVITSKILYKLTMEVFQKNEKQLPRSFNITKCAYYSSFLLIIQPSGIFSVVAYAETSVQFLCYAALYCYFVSRSRVAIQNKALYFLSGSLFSIAFGFRSNCLLYGAMYLFDLKQFNGWVDLFWVLFTGMQLFWALLYSTYVPFQFYCPDRGGWCNSYTKSLVSYAQAHYWKNGLFMYFTAGNIPLFMIAGPQLGIILFSTLNFRKWKGVAPVLIVSVIYLTVQFFIMHVQIVNRVSTFIPIHLWYVSYLLTLQNNRLGKNITRWWIVWVFVQTALYSAFLPPA